MAGRTPKVELLWWNGCPSTERAVAELREVMTELGIEAAALQTRQVETEQSAAAEGFVGSPTLRIDGRDLEPGAVDGQEGLTCRVYRLRDGRVSPTPDPADVRAALLHAMSDGS